MNNLNLILPEIFISLSIMFSLILGVFKKNSSNIIHNLSIGFLLIGCSLLFFNVKIFSSYIPWITNKIPKKNINIISNFIIIIN